MSVLSSIVRRGGAVVLGAALVAGAGATGSSVWADAGAVAGAADNVVRTSGQDHPHVGQAIENKGVYVGVRELKDLAGKSLGVFDLYAGPEDLTDGHGKRLPMTFNEAVTHVAGLRNWHGHDGGGFQNEATLYEAMRKGRYHGEWFIPPLDVVEENLYPNRETGALKATFSVSGSDGAFWYWSCTERPDNPSFVYGVDFALGGGAWGHKVSYGLVARVVRAELRP